MTARRSAPREPEGGEGSSKEARKGGGKGGGKAADEVASAIPGRIIVPDAPTIIRPAMDPTLLPGEPADDGFLALPPDRLRLAALRERFYYPPANWHVEQHSDRVLLPGVSGELRPASVLVPIIDRPAGPVVLLTQRTTHLRQHSGQVAFPGGRVEAHDRDVIHTALREAEEEVGLDPALVEVVGRMPEYTTGTGFRVTPVVGLVSRDAVLVPDPGEVAAVFEAPLAFLMDPRNHERRRYDVDGVTRTFFAMPWGPPGQEPYFIWGATAAMLRNLYHFLRAD